MKVVLPGSRFRTGEILRLASGIYFPFKAGEQYAHRIPENNGYYSGSFRFRRVSAILLRASCIQESWTTFPLLM